MTGEGKEEEFTPLRGSAPPPGRVGGGVPFSPFPYGSPLQRAGPSPTPRSGSKSETQKILQTSFSGSPGQKLLLSSFFRDGASSEDRSLVNGSLITPRLKGQDLYGGPVMFGSSARKTRLLSSTPYSSALRLRDRDRQKSRSISGTVGLGGTMGLPTGGYTGLGGTTGLPTGGYTGFGGNTTAGGSVGTTSMQSSNSSRGSSGGSSPGNPPTDSMSTTARMILETLDKMSTPIQDAMKMPVARAEKRKIVEDELNISLGIPSRRRPRLGAGTPGSSLSGPPLRKNYSPLPVSSTHRNRLTPGGVLGRSSPVTPAPSGGFLGRVTSATPTPTPPAPPTSSSSQFAESSSIPKTTSATPISFSATPSLTSAASLTPSSQPSLSSGLSFPPFSLSSAPFSASIPFSPPEPSLSSGSLKMKSKVSEVVRSRGVQEEKEEKIPSHLTHDIPVLKAPSALPSFSFQPAQSISSMKPAPPPVSSASSSSPSIMFSFNKPSNPCKDSVSTKDAPSGVLKDTVSSKDTTKDKVNSKDTVISGETCLEIYAFRSPVVVTSKQGLGSVGAHYSFTSPTQVKSMLTSRNLGGNFKSAAMPDVTYNFKTKTGEGIRGVEKGGLPDITASTVFAPAKTLKMGSVMDILGKKC